jgi:hypothetical protein
MERINMTKANHILKYERDVWTGYTNYETWAVSLWLWTRQEALEYWREAAREARRFALRYPQVREQLRTEEDVARSRLADQMMWEVCGEAPIAEDSLSSDLLRWALAEVEWLEVADEFLAIPEPPE